MVTYQIIFNYSNHKKKLVVNPANIPTSNIFLKYSSSVCVSHYLKLLRIRVGRNCGHPTAATKNLF